MTTGEWVGWIGGIAGSVIGIAGGIVGTYFGIKKTKGPRERVLIIKFSIVFWAGIFIFMALLFALPNPYRWFMWFPYGVLLPFGIIYTNRKLQAIRQQESKNQ